MLIVGGGKYDGKGGMELKKKREKRVEQFLSYLHPINTLLHRELYGSVK